MDNQEIKTDTQKPRKGEFKCFHCRHIFASKEGNWYPWSHMEVHLCQACARLTENQPNRKSR